MLPTAKNQKKRLTNRTGRCTIQLSTNRVTPLCPCHPLSGIPPFTRQHTTTGSATALLVAVLGREKEQPKGCSFFISGGISAPCRRANGAETAESSGAGTSFRRRCLLPAFQARRGCPASVQSAVLFPEQDLHPAAEHGVLRPGQQRVAGQ